jgi:Ser/Thr protein kinase RdoA (MazF antagonist)
VFSPRINENVEAVASHLVSKGLSTPQLVRTAAGEPLAIDDEGRAWRLLTWVSGDTHDVVGSPGQAWAAARFVGRWHAALEDLRHDFVGLRGGVHDTSGHLARLRSAVSALTSHRLHADVVHLHAAIERALPTLTPIDDTLTLLGHGDLKINNLLFQTGDPDEPIALVDLDTVGPQALAFELGDAMRSWCNPAGEVADGIAFSLDVHDAIIAGWLEGRGRSLTARERDALVSGVEWITLELATRFLVDALEERYFGWDATRFATRGEHNLARARGQWRLHELAVEARSARQRALDAPP